MSSYTTITTYTYDGLVEKAARLEAAEERARQLTDELKEVYVSGEFAARLAQEHWERARQAEALVHLLGEALVIADERMKDWAPLEPVGPKLRAIPDSAMGEILTVSAALAAYRAFGGGRAHG